MFRKAYRVNYTLYIYRAGELGLFWLCLILKEKLIGKKNPFHGKRE